jgi:hypothetical protein
MPVSDERSHSGSYALKFAFGPNAPGEDAFKEQRFDTGRDSPEVWIEYMMYVPDNWEIRSGEAPANNKLFSIWANSYSRTGDIQAVFEYEGFDGGESDIRVLCMSGPGCDNGTKYTHVLDTTMRGEWIRIRVHVKSGPAGIVEFWRDDTLVYARYDYLMEFAGGNNFWRIGYILGWANSGFDEQTVFYVDSVKFYDDNPGWGR